MGDFSGATHEGSGGGQYIPLGFAHVSNLGLQADIHRSASITGRSKGDIGQGEDQPAVDTTQCIAMLFSDM